MWVLYVRATSAKCEVLYEPENACTEIGCAREIALDAASDDDACVFSLGRQIVDCGAKIARPESRPMVLSTAFLNVFIRVRGSV